MTTIEVAPLPSLGTPLPVPKRHTINVPLMRKVLEYLETNPEKHEQGCWAWSDAATVAEATYDCGTVACMAGWTVLLADVGRWLHMTCCDECAATLELQAVIDGDTYDVAEGAERLLGLTSRQGDQMFSGSNSRDDLWDYADEFTFGDIDSNERLAFRG